MKNMENKQNIDNDFILLHLYNKDSIILRLKDIQSISKRENYTCIDMYYDHISYLIKESCEEIYKIINNMYGNK